MRSIERGESGWPPWALALVLAGSGCAMEVPPACGDGLVEGGEACDDGNALSGDGCSAQCRIERGTVRADVVLDAPGATGEGYGDPTRAVNGVRGGGLRMQSLDVYSIAIGDHLTLGWDGSRVVDGPGDDLVVFENAFEYGDGLTFMDAAIVEVSTDGAEWVALPHDYVAEDERVYTPRRDRWIGFAGVTPVLLNDDEPAIEAFDDEAGGDRFDLASIAGTEEGDAILRQGACCVRITAAAAHTNPDTGEAFVADVVSNGPDIDGVAARYVVEAR